MGDCTFGRQLARSLSQVLSRRSTASTARPAPRSPALRPQPTLAFSKWIPRRSDDKRQDSSTALANALRSGSTTPPGPGRGPAQVTGDSPTAAAHNMMDILSNSLTRGASGAAHNQRRIDTSSLIQDPRPREAAYDDSEEPFHFHIYSHKHNTHVTITKPNRDAIMSVSCGRIGFKKSNRKHYDSAYQLGAHVIDLLHQGNWHNRIRRLEVIMRGFGPGRDAVQKVLMSNEGRLWRPKVVRVTDSTRLKFGGTRSKAPRRLG